MKQKRGALLAIEGLSEREADRAQNIPRGSEKTILRAPGRPEITLFKVELITFMKDASRESRPLTFSFMVSYVRDEHPVWLQSYTEKKKDTFTAYESLLRLLRVRARLRAAYSAWVEGKSWIKKYGDLEAVQNSFACVFEDKHSNYSASEVFNCDETGVYFDVPPGKILSEGGQSSAITAQQKNSARLTACTWSQTIIDNQELPTYPEGHVYTVQSKAWMDAWVWKFYLRSLLQQHITCNSLLFVDNLECHGSGEAEAIVLEELMTVLQPLPKISTSVCQPLDIGIMGYLKEKLKALRLTETTTASTAKE
ncbi:hypothetical protein PHMEG_00026056 [Phytophthora megakarya]|uniref:DDE-1 domain-containing protein n=1 Tax=Phytophthora megakarya TaxID=4795 RepID=A0A225VBB7_9STRA|nr:hypothetical protein PHMEG_00026056 [Phytophthora megakarya]